MDAAGEQVTQMDIQKRTDTRYFEKDCYICNIELIISDMKKAYIVIVAIFFALCSCSSELMNRIMIEGTWKIYSVSVCVADKWIEASEEIVESFGITWTFTDNFLIVDGENAIEYEVDDDIIVIDNGTSFKILSIDDDTLEIGKPTTSPTVIIKMKKE